MPLVRRPRPRLPFASISEADRRLLAAADRAGDADGTATPEEVRSLAATLEERPVAAYDRDAPMRRRRARRLATRADDVPPVTLDPELRALPESLRRLALEVDAMWGNADGTVDSEELDRVALYFLGALPFFVTEAASLLELADHLGLDRAGALRPAGSVHALRAALSEVDGEAAARARPFAELFDEAVRTAEIPGEPGLLRDALSHSPRWHRLSILEHTATAVAAIQELAAFVGRGWQEAGAVMLLHDVGKVLTRNPHRQRGTARFNYWGHDEVGARWLEARGVPEPVVFHVRHHNDLDAMTASEVIEVADGEPEGVARMLLVFLADHVAKGDTPDQMESFARMRPKLIALAQVAGLDGEALIDETERLRAEWFAATVPHARTGSVEDT